MLGHRVARGGILVTLAVIVAAAFAPGCAATTDDAEEAADDRGLDPADFQDEDEPEPGTVSSEARSCNQCSNCVLYARCRQPRLPYGLTTFAQKRARINSGTPRVGCVAVIRSGSSYGHVAYVKSVRGGTIGIDEGNWPSGRCGSRSGTESSLSIVGYICP